MRYVWYIYIYIIPINILVELKDEKIRQISINVARKYVGVSIYASLCRMVTL